MSRGLSRDPADHVLPAFSVRKSNQLRYRGVPFWSPSGVWGPPRRLPEARDAGHPNGPPPRPSTAGTATARPPATGGLRWPVQRYLTRPRRATTLPRWGWRWHRRRQRREAATHGGGAVAGGGGGDGSGGSGGGIGGGRACGDGGAGGGPGGDGDGDGSSSGGGGRRRRPRQRRCAPTGGWRAAAAALALDQRRGASGWCVVTDAAAPPPPPLPLPPPPRPRSRGRRMASAAPRWGHLAPSPRRRGGNRWWSLSACPSP